MQTANILVVEDDPDINRLLCKILENGGHCCRPAFSGSEALLWAEKYEYDLVLLDLMLPGLTGEEFLAEIRKKKTMPILVLSAKVGVADRVNVLKLGADDFIPKPPLTMRRCWPGWRPSCAATAAFPPPRRKTACSPSAIWCWTGRGHPSPPEGRR